MSLETASTLAKIMLKADSSINLWVHNDLAN
jgi:hypothetical protein